MKLYQNVVYTLTKNIDEFVKKNRYISFDSFFNKALLTFCNLP